MTLDYDHRKLIVGSTNGELKVFDILSGINTFDLHSHADQYQKELAYEISYIGYGGADHTIITIGWDNVIKIHHDEEDESKKHIGDEQQDHKKNLWTILRGRVNCHKKEILCGDYSGILDLIATGGRDKVVRLWEYERVLV